MEPGTVVPQYPEHLVFTGVRGLVAAHGGDEPSGLKDHRSLSILDLGVEIMVIAQRFAQSPASVVRRVGIAQNILDQVLLVLQRHPIKLDEMPLGFYQEQGAQPQHHRGRHRGK